jgi:hypothetical protein
MCTNFDRDEGYINDGSDHKVVCKKTCHIMFHREALERDVSHSDRDRNRRRNRESSSGDNCFHGKGLDWIGYGRSDKL